MLARRAIVNSKPNPYTNAKAKACAKPHVRAHARARCRTRARIHTRVPGRIGIPALGGTAYARPTKPHARLTESPRNPHCHARLRRLEPRPPCPPVPLARAGGVPPSFATHALFSGAALLIAGARDGLLGRQVDRHRGVYLSTWPMSAASVHLIDRLLGGEE
eukprot:3366270-Pleurochrysis_carterae.AAC.1